MLDAINSQIDSYKDEYLETTLDLKVSWKTRAKRFKKLEMKFNKLQYKI